MIRCVTDANCKLTGAAESTQTAGRNVPVVFRFRAKVTDSELLSRQDPFRRVSRAIEPGMADSVELTLPVEPPTIIRTESVAGSFTGPNFDVKSTMPEPWRNGHGKLDVTVSSSAWLPEIAGLPAILDYPHGCFEQISSRLLGYALLGDLFAYLPNAEARDPSIERLLSEECSNLTIRCWKTGCCRIGPAATSGHAFVTAQAFWAVNEAANAGLPSSPNAWATAARSAYEDHSEASARIRRLTEFLRYSC